MKREHFMAFDVHCKTTEIAVADRSGPPRKVWRCPTTIIALSEAITSVPRPRRVVMEEGPLAEWLLRELGQLVDAFVVCDPRRNHLIAKDSDKDDPIDAAKLLVLFRGGYTKAVHHPDSFELTAFKRRVNAYHDRVEHRVSEALKIIWFLRHYGVMVNEAAFASPSRRGELLKRLPSTGGVRSTLGVYWFANRRLKDMILGAAVSAIASGRNPFADQYQEWLHAGISPRNARRNVARSLATTLWGMWKSGSVYRADWVGVSVASAGRPLPRRPVSMR